MISFKDLILKSECSSEPFKYKPISYYDLPEEDYSRKIKIIIPELPEGGK
jgi:hypothetical protein